jgi:hypothetical protein
MLDMADSCDNDKQSKKGAWTPEEDFKLMEAVGVRENPALLSQELPWDPAII